MKTKGYLFFHLNLAYSSIEEEAWSKVISNCYHPLLSLSEKTDIPIGIELTGWTLKQINRLDPSWVSRFIELHKKGNCELIGSGYCQIIAPLVPFKVNEWNQKLGLKVYKKILNQAPNIALVNEMAFSNSLVNLYSQNGYKGLIMDGDNIKLAINSQKPKTEKTMTGKKATEVKVDPELEENKETGKKGVEQLKKETKLKGKDLQAACGAPASSAPSTGLGAR